VFATIGPFDEFYAVEGFNEPKPAPLAKQDSKKYAKESEAEKPKSANPSHQKRHVTPAQNSESKKKAGGGSAIKSRAHANPPPSSAQ